MYCGKLEYGRCSTDVSLGPPEVRPIWVFMSLQDIKCNHLTCTLLSSARALCSSAVGAAQGTFGGCLTPQQQYASIRLLFLPSPFPSRACSATLKAQLGRERQQVGGVVFGHCLRTQTVVAFLMQRNSFQPSP